MQESETKEHGSSSQEQIAQVEEVITVDTVEILQESTGKEHKEKTEELKDNEDSIISTSTKEEKNNDTLPSSVTARVTVDGEVEVSAEIKDGNWLSVSPGKAGRSNEKRLESETIISPSRFQLLAEEEDEQSTTQGTEVSATDPALLNDVEDVEEGEIVQKDEVGLNLQEHKGKASNPIRSARVAKRVTLKLLLLSLRINLVA